MAALLVAAARRILRAFLRARRLRTNQRPAHARGADAAAHGGTSNGQRHALDYGATTIIVATQQGRVAALRTDTGSVVWRWSGRTVDTTIRSADTVYIASHPSGNDGNTSLLTALRASDGVQRWQVREPQLAGYIYMYLDDNVLVVASGYGNGSIYGPDAHTGKTNWPQPGVGGLIQRLITAPAGITYVSNVDGGFNAYNTPSHKLLWNYNDGNGPVVTQGNNGPSIVAGTGGLIHYYNFELVSGFPPSFPMVVTLNAVTGAVQHRLTLGEIGRPLLVTPDGDVYATRDSQLCEFRVADGARLWCTASNESANFAGDNYSARRVPSPTVLLFSKITNNGTSPTDSAIVGALNNSTGKQIWIWQGPSSLYSASNSMSLARQGNTPFLTTNKGIFAFRITDGKLLWHALATTNLSFVQPALAS